MAQGAGQMPFEDVAVQQLRFTAAHRRDEVPEMIAAAAELRQHLTVGRVGDGILVAGNDEVTVRAMEDIADLDALVVPADQAAYLEDQLTVAVVEDGNLRVGRLAIVDVAEAS